MCTVGCSIQEQLQSRKLLKQCRKLCEIQRKELNGAAGGSLSGDDIQHHAGGEQPLRASSWKLSELRDMVQMCGGERFGVDGCMLGLRDAKSGEFIRKPWGWFSSLPSIRTALEKRCVHGKCAHENIRGPKAAPTAIYPRLLCRRFAKALMEEVPRYPKGGKICPEPQIFSASDLYDEELADALEEPASGSAIEPGQPGRLGVPEGQPEGIGEPEGAHIHEGGEESQPVDPEIRRKIVLSK